MITLLRTILIAIALLSTLTTLPAIAKPPSVTVITPAKTTNQFWGNLCDFMQIAADSLTVDLTIVEAKDRFQVEDKAQQILKSSRKPDYLVFI